MKILEPGHVYALESVGVTHQQVVRFRRDIGIHGEAAIGTSCQELLRVVLNRLEFLDSERPWPGNAAIALHLRKALLGFECRALERKVEKGWKVEQCPVALDGHLMVFEDLFGED